MVRDQLLARLRELRPWLREQGVNRVRLFGSYARDEAGPDSDVDLLVELARPMGWEFFGVQEQLSEKIGLKVEMFTEDELHRVVRREVEAEAILA